MFFIRNWFRNIHYYGNNYYIYGFENRLILTSGTEIEENHLSCQSTTFSWSERNYKLFVFYVTFYPRIHNKVGRSVEINYTEVKFPLNFYTRLTDNDLALLLFIIII